MDLLSKSLRMRVLDNGFIDMKGDYIMKHIDYFKMQAKNLLKDLKAKRISEESKTIEVKYFDVERIALDFNISDEEFSLMKAQHIISKLAGCNKWAELIKLPDKKLILIRSKFSNNYLLAEQNKIRSSLAFLNDMAEDLYGVWANRELDYVEEFENGEDLNWYIYDSDEWDMLEIINSFDFDEENFTIEEAKYVIAYYAGLGSWNIIKNLSAKELEYAILRLMNRNKIDPEEWDFLSEELIQNNGHLIDLDTEMSIFEEYYLKQ